MKRRLAIITEIIAPYRTPVFNVLAGYPEIDLHVIFLAETDRSRYQWLVDRNALEFSHEVLPSWRKRIGQHDFLLNWGAEQSLQRFAPDGIVCGGYNYVAAWKALRWAKQHSVPFYLWVESNANDQRSGSLWVETLKSRFVGQCDGFVVPGQAARDYVKSYGRSQEISVAPNAVNTEFFAEHSAAARLNASKNRFHFNLPPRYFLFVGRFVAEKGIFDLLEAYRALPQSVRNEVGLVLVGDGPARPEIEKLASTTNSGTVKIVGFAQGEKLAAYYGLADIFVFPTHTDPWGLVVNEAMSCGLPVICSNVAGCTRDLIEEGVTGRLVRPRHIGQLAAVMEQLARDPVSARRLGENARLRIAAYSPAACAAGIANAVLCRRVAA